MTSILDYAKAPYPLREQQIQALRFVEDNWDNADVFVIQAPVATGKSLISMTIARWVHNEKKKKSQIIVPTNILLEQYKNSFPRVHFLQRKDLYRCKRYADQPELLQEDANCDWTKEVFGNHCEGCCYLKAVKQSHVVPYMFVNAWTYMAHKLFTPVVCFDEAHNLLHIIRDLEGKRIWRKDYHYPSTITTYGDLLKWVESHPRRDADTKLKLLYEELNTGRGHFLVETSVDLYRGRQEECLKLCPIDVRNARPYLWPHANSKGKGGVSKIILMSATFTRVDLEMLGLNKRRVAIMETGSPIPPERRPVYFMPIVNSSFKFQNASLPKLISFLKELATARPGVKGFVHTTYGMGAKMKELLSTDRRFFFHSSDNKIEKFKEWKASDPKEGRIFVGCGMDEGIDLNGEEFGWQVLTKAQYASLAEPAIKHQAEERPAEYTWDAMRKCAQACGRICRDPQDYGETYLVDLTFKRLFKQAKEFGVVPNWLAEQLDEDARRELLE